MTGVKVLQHDGCEGVAAWQAKGFGNWSRNFLSNFHLLIV